MIMSSERCGVLESRYLLFKESLESEKQKYVKLRFVKYVWKIQGLKCHFMT